MSAAAAPAAYHRVADASTRGRLSVLARGSFVDSRGAAVIPGRSARSFPPRQARRVSSGFAAPARFACTFQAGLRLGQNCLAAVRYRAGRRCLRIWGDSRVPSKRATRRSVRQRGAVAHRFLRSTRSARAWIRRQLALVAAMPPSPAPATDQPERAKPSPARAIPVSAARGPLDVSSCAGLRSRSCRGLASSSMSRRASMPESAA